MYYFLTEAVKRRFLLELRNFWSYHPKYKDLPDNIVGKYSFSEMPNHAIILKSVSASHVQLSADNFMGTKVSYVQLVRVDDKPGLSVEWVREDSLAIQKNDGRFPSPPGIYYLSVEALDEALVVPGQVNGLCLYVDPLLEIYDERPTVVDGFRHNLSHPYLQDSTRVYEMPGNLLYQRESHYTEDAAGGAVILRNPLTDGRYIVVSYRYPATSSGPILIYENYANKSAIPGVVLAFGRRMEAGDRQAVIVHKYRQDSSLVYGGKWDLSMDFDIMARDVYAQQEISDLTVTYLFGVLRNRLSSEGIEITSVSMGGESEDVYDDNGDDYFYNSNFSVQVLTDWQIEVPVGPALRRIMTISPEDADASAGMSDEQLLASGIGSSIEAMTSLHLSNYSDPFFNGRTSTFERVR